MFKRQLANRKGNAIIEFALVLPLLLGILGGAVDFCLAFFVSHVVQNAAREGARYAVTRVELSPDDPVVIARVQERLPNVELFSPFRTAIKVTPNTIGPDCDVRVEVAGWSPYFF